MEKLKKNPYDILIADDNPDNLKILAQALKSEGFKVRFAKNGKQVLESIKEVEPELIILDIHMPEMDGFDVCKYIRIDMNNYYLPIIFLSALSDQFNIVKAFDCGASDYVIKPFNTEELKARIKYQLEIREKLCKLKKFLKSDKRIGL